jgi:hypothetical protein
MLYMWFAIDLKVGSCPKYFVVFSIIGGQGCPQFFVTLYWLGGLVFPSGFLNLTRLQNINFVSHLFDDSSLILLFPLHILLVNIF